MGLLNIAGNFKHRSEIRESKDEHDRLRGAT